MSIKRRKKKTKTTNESATTTVTIANGIETNIKVECLLAQNSKIDKDRSGIKQIA